MDSSTELVPRPDWARAAAAGLSPAEQDLILPSAREPDLDVFRDRLNSAYYPAVVDTTSRDHGLSDGRLGVRRLRRMTIGFARFGRDALVDPGRIDGYHVNVPLAGTVASESGDQTMLARPGTAAVFSRHARTRLPRWTADAAQLCIKIDRLLVEDELEMLLGRPLRDGVEFGIALPLTSGAGRGWSRQLWSLLDAIETEDLPERVLDYLERATIVKLLYSADHCHLDELTGGTERTILPRTLRRVLDAVAESPQHLHTPSDLAAEAGVSIRRLERSFRDHLGVTPSAYLTRVRLERAREDLEHPASNVSVTAVMYRWGFGNHARFAALYRERYGENPRATLARAMNTRGPGAGSDS